jgi:hypothetical protein
MLTMDKIKDIRFRYFVKGEKISHIARELHMDWKTVQKYVDMTDFNKSAPKPAFEQRFCPKLDPYKPTIDQWLEEDKKAPRKQRHTAKRVFVYYEQNRPRYRQNKTSLAEKSGHPYDKQGQFFFYSDTYGSIIKLHTVV